MDTFSQTVYVSEVAKQCHFAVGAIGQLNHALESMHETRLSPERRQFFHNEVFRSIHSFLTHTSNVSRLLWPAAPTRGNGENDDAYEARLSSKPAIVRARALRASLSLSDEHVLKSRRLRDLLEHFDEKLDEWRSSSVHRNIVNDLIGPRNAIVGIAESDMMRWFDPSTRSFTFRGETFDLQALATGANQLLHLANATKEQLRQRMTNEMREMHSPHLKPTPQGGAA